MLPHYYNGVQDPQVYTMQRAQDVAIKRAQEGSLQGEREFLTEIELLSRVHHRNLMSLAGYCDEEGEQVLFSHLD